MASAESTEMVTESVHDVIARQFGLITRPDAAKFGIGSAAIARRIASREWARALPRIYRATAAEVTERQRALAAVLWAGDGALVSHATAARLWEFEHVRGNKIEIWLAYPHNRRHKDVTVHRGTRLDRADRTVLDGIP